MRPIGTRKKNGIVLLKKKPGQTSFQALYPIKREYGLSVGHTGTLDSFAEGLLVVLVGKFTKFNPLFTAFDKVYEADFYFGRETSTLDPEGETVFAGPLPHLDPSNLRERWIGPQMQIPPVYSAVHVDGQRASDRVRKGQTVELRARPITIYSLEVLRWASPILTIKMECSKGTYVRSLARDWGRATDSGAHVTRLKRWQVGPFQLPEDSDMVFLDDHETLERLGIPELRLKDEAVSFILNGRDPVEWVPELNVVSGPFAGLRDSQNRLVAVVDQTSGRWKYLFVDREDP